MIQKDGNKAKDYCALCERCFHEKIRLKDSWREITSDLTKLSCVLMVTFSGENGLAEVKEGDSGETLACADDAYKADVYT